MTKDILLSLKGLQMEYAEDSDAVETITPASYYRKGGSHYIVYDEMTEGFTESDKRTGGLHSGGELSVSGGLPDRDGASPEKGRNQPGIAKSRNKRCHALRVR